MLHQPLESGRTGCGSCWPNCVRTARCIYGNRHGPEPALHSLIHDTNRGLQTMFKICSQTSSQHFSSREHLRSRRRKEIFTRPLFLGGVCIYLSSVGYQAGDIHTMNIATGECHQLRWTCVRPVTSHRHRGQKSIAHELHSPNFSSWQPNLNKVKI